MAITAVTIMKGMNIPLGLTDEHKIALIFQFLQQTTKLTGYVSGSNNNYGIIYQ